MPLNMGNLTDDKMEEILKFLRHLARMELYDEEDDFRDGDAAWNWAVQSARDLLK